MAGGWWLVAGGLAFRATPCGLANVAGNTGVSCFIVCSWDSKHTCVSK